MRPNNGRGGSRVEAEGGMRNKDKERKRKEKGRKATSAAPTF